MNIPIIYEDEWLLVVNKPAGLLTIPAPNKQRRSLIRILNEDSKDKGLSFRLHPCHRLDQDTSGLIIFAKGKSIQKRLMQEFKKKRIYKTYIAFVDGSLPENKGFIKTSINGKTALTRWKMLERFKDFSVIEVNPLTGRKNQIRLHFRQIRHPIIGEDRFAFRKDFKIKAKRLCLHAKGLDFEHPVTRKPIHLEIDLPEYLKRFLGVYCK